MSKNIALLNAVIEGIKEKRGNNIISMDFEGMESSICDYFVICDAQSHRQVESIADSIQEFAFKQAKEKPVHVEGKENSDWVLLDFTDIVVHVFQEDAREFYALEKLWADTKVEKHEAIYSKIV